jgi:putative PEP-CTERM system TPR-repeat lipoprotein
MTFHLKGGVLLAKQDVAGARVALEKSLQLDPSFMPAARTLASLDLADKKPDAAKKRFQDIITRDPKNTTAYLALAQIQDETGSKIEEVQATLERAVAANTSNVLARSALINNYRKSGDVKKALSAANDALAALPNDQSILGLLGAVQVQAGELEQGVATFRKLVALQPQSPAALVTLSDAQKINKDLTGAEQSLRKALVLKPDMVEAQQRLVALFINNKRFEAAINIAAEMRKQHPNSPMGWLQQGDIEAAAGRHQDALKSFNQARTAYPKMPDPVLRIFDLYNQLGQTAEADRTLGEWFKVFPKDVMLRTYLAERYLAQGKYQQSVTLFLEMLPLSPTNPILLNNIAWAYGQLKDPKAMEYAQQAFKYAPENPVVLDTLGMLHVAAGNRNVGIDTLKKAVALAPRAVEIQMNLAKACVAAGRKDEAKTALEAVIRLLPEKAPLRQEATRMREQL